ncbi:MAG: TIGR00269 family protein, partial [Asgard group archaeon]|nr:TIGR00269 family protein [Asgard group archaeon]
VLDAIEQKFPSELIAVCIDEGIKEYREDGIPIARKTAKKLGIEFHLYSFKELYGFTLDEMVARSQFLLEKLPRNKQNKILQQGPCAFCGVFRRKALNYAARNLEGDKLATGHNLNDVDQTILLNLLRGDAKKILTRDLPREQVHELFIPRVKPLRAVSERDIILYAVFNDLDYHTTDCPYSIQAMRLDVRNFLTAIEDHYPGSLHCIKNSVETIIDSCNIEQSEKKQQAQKTINRCKICNEPTSNEICQACKIIQLLGK